MSQRKDKTKDQASDDDHFPFGSRPWSSSFRAAINDAVEDLRKSRLPWTSDVQEVKAVTAPDEPVSVSMSSEQEAIEFSIPKPPEPAPPRWHGLGDTVEVEGFEVPGMVWVADRVASTARFRHACIDTSLEVRKGRAAGDILLPSGDVEVKSYHDLLPAGREMFLRWLASGCTSHAPAHLVLLYMHGLEARLVDVGPNDLEEAERRTMLRMVRSLVARFNTLANDISEIGAELEAVLTLADFPPKMYLRSPDTLVGRWPWDQVCQACLAQASYDEAPLPAAWALVCMPKTSGALVRSDEEFAQAFALQYELEYPNGAPLVQLGGPLEVAYLSLGRYGGSAVGAMLTATAEHTAKASLSDGALAHIGRIVQRVQADLAVFDRYVKTNPGSRGTADAEVRLPVYLLVPRYRARLQELGVPLLTAEELCDSLWGTKLASRTSAPFLRAFHAALYAGAIASQAPVEQVLLAPRSPAMSKSKDFKLDQARIAQLHREEVELAKLLNGVFVQDQADEGESASVGAPTKPEAALPGLDVEQTRMLKDVLARELWTRSELEALAAVHSLMLDGALEQINEAAMDLAGGLLLVDEDDDIEVDAEVAEGLRTVLQAV